MFITNSKDKYIYINHLVDRIYKILPLSEENKNKIPKIYVKRLIDDVISANELFNGTLINLIIKLNILLIKESTHFEIKSIVFECINLCKKIIHELERCEDIGFDIL